VLAAAQVVVLSHGYTPYPNTRKHWHSAAPLNVIVGTSTGSADGYNTWAFFFVNGRFIGTDTKNSSAGIRVAWANGTTIALTYVLYKPSDPMCCPSAGTATVRFHWTGSRLVALDPIPPDSGSGPSRIRRPAGAGATSCGPIAGYVRIAQLKQRFRRRAQQLRPDHPAHRRSPGSLRPAAERRR
jgi:hypothetical protein